MLFKIIFTKIYIKTSTINEGAYINFPRVKIAIEIYKLNK